MEEVVEVVEEEELKHAIVVREIIVERMVVLVLVDC
jgi:hypothetical protein